MPPKKAIQRLPPSTPAAVAEDHRRRLVALRDRLEAELSVASTVYVAAISRQLQSVLGELATMRDPNAERNRLEQLQSRFELCRGEAKAAQDSNGVG